VDDFDECFRIRTTSEAVVVAGVGTDDVDAFDSTDDDGDVCSARDGSGETSPEEHEVRVDTVSGDCVEMVSLGVVDTTTVHWCGLHRGEMVVDFLACGSARRCMRSGDSARRSSGELGSADLGLAPNAFLAEPGVRLAPGEYVCVVLDDPGTCTAMGDGDRVGEASGSGDGDGVRASGDSGMWPTDLRRLGECSAFVLACSLCLRPCREDGLAVDGDGMEPAAGEHGSESAGEDDSDASDAL
jgi:hypothetical protein